MKTTFKRTTSFMMALIMTIGIVVTSTFSVSAQNVSYVYDGRYIKNWGTREELATFLSQNAIAFYQKNNTSYDALDDLAGSSNINSVPSSALYKALQDLMKNNHKTLTSYGDIRDLADITDIQNSGKTSNKISTIYSGKAVGPGWDGGGTWDREHCWPKSKTAYPSVSNGSQCEASDIMTIRPSVPANNSSRSNTAYGKGSSYFFPNKFAGGVYDVRGDVARMMLYTYVRWGNTSKMWGTGGVIESKAVLLEWMEADPVDTWELGRNDSVESITGTRNVFVDYPELAFILFDEDIPVNYASPSGEGKNSTGGGSGNTGSGNSGSDNTGSGNAGAGNSGTGNSGSGNQGAGNSGTGNTPNPSCTHANAYNVAAESARCDLTGYTAGKYCPDCKAYISGHEVVAAKGHSFSDGVCTVCHKSESDVSQNQGGGDSSGSGNIGGGNPNDNNEPIAWWIWVALGGAVILVGTGTALVIIFRKKIFAKK